MNAWSFYDPKTGLLWPAVYRGPDSQLAVNVPEGYEPIRGEFDPLCQRVDVGVDEPLQVIDYQPPPPPDEELRTWAWDDKTRRWQPQPTEAALLKQRAAELRDQIAAQEAAQARPMREVLIALAAGKQPPAVALQKLAAIEQAVAPLRLEIQDASADVRTPD